MINYIVKENWECIKYHVDYYTDIKWNTVSSLYVLLKMFNKNDKISKADFYVDSKGSCNEV